MKSWKTDVLFWRISVRAGGLSPCSAQGCMTRRWMDWQRPASAFRGAVANSQPTATGPEQLARGGSRLRVAGYQRALGRGRARNCSRAQPERSADCNRQVRGRPRDRGRAQTELIPSTICSPGLESANPGDYDLQ